MNAAVLNNRYVFELNDIIAKLCEKHFLHLAANKVVDILNMLAPVAIERDQSFLNGWNSLQEDQYMADGGRYRKRRHAVFEVGQALQKPRLIPCQPHYQPKHYNQLNGGIERYFAPILPELIASPTLSALLDFGTQLFHRITGLSQWRIELHQFRIEARDGQQGRPTPEGVHRDGVDYVIVVMIKRVNIKSGATTIYNLQNQLVGEFTLLHSFDMAIVDDRKVYHGVTPITAIDVNQEAFRDVLVITYNGVKY